MQPCRQVTFHPTRKRVRASTMEITTKRIKEFPQCGDIQAAEALHRDQLNIWEHSEHLTATDVKSKGVALRHPGEAKLTMRGFYNKNNNGDTLFASLTANAALVYDDYLEDLDGPTTPAPKRFRLHQSPLTDAGSSEYTLICGETAKIPSNQTTLAAESAYSSKSNESLTEG